MDFALSEEQQELAGLAARILEDRMTLPHLKARDRSDDWYDLDGLKGSVPGAAAAELVVVPARVDDGVGVFLVPTNASGVTLERQEVMNHEPLFEVRLDGVRVGDDARLGTPEQGSEILAFALNRTMVASWS